MSSSLARRIPAAIARPARTFSRVPHPQRCPVRFQSRATATEPTTPPPSFQRKKKKGSWRGMLLRWGAAGGGVWWYLSSPLFAEEPEARFISPPPFVDEDQATVAAVVAKKRAELQAIEEAKAREKAEGEKLSSTQDKLQGEQQQNQQPVTDAEAQQAGQEAQGAFNPETGEINWDCPCLGGMADGPCGPEFREAFSCFVFSTEEPKGMDCIGKFQGMQECFRKYPEVYAEELRDDAPADKTASQDKAEDGKTVKASDNKTDDETGESKADNRTDDNKTGDSKTDNKTDDAKASAPKDSNTHLSASIEDLDRRLDTRGSADGSEAEEGRHVDAADANAVKAENKQAKKD